MNIIFTRIEIAIIGNLSDDQCQVIIETSSPLSPGDLRKLAKHIEAGAETASLQVSTPGNDVEH
jgi:hypothetical protein